MSSQGNMENNLDNVNLFYVIDEEWEISDLRVEKMQNLIFKEEGVVIPINAKEQLIIDYFKEELNKYTDKISAPNEMLKKYVKMGHTHLERALFQGHYNNNIFKYICFAILICNYPRRKVSDFKKHYIFKACLRHMTNNRISNIFAVENELRRVALPKLRSMRGNTTYYKCPNRLYIGRKTKKMQQSKWHNPFRIDAKCNRKRCIVLYAKYFNSRLREQIPELLGKTLYCWCTKFNPFGNNNEDNVTNLTIPNMECHGQYMIYECDQYLKKLNLSMSKKLYKKITGREMLINYFSYFKRNYLAPYYYMGSS